MFVALACALALLTGGARISSAQTKNAASAPQKEDDMSERYRGRVRAPELTGGRGWLNTEQPLALAALRGKIVLLDFWTYGCINCIHIIPDLKRLEAKYGNQLIVIGVHSAKFDNEKETDNIRQVVLRYEIEHPVVNDADFAIWGAYAVRAWPTQYLIDPAGYVVGRVEGEGNYEVLDQTIAATVADFRQRGELNEEPLKLALERARLGDQPLAFPGKLLADAKTDRLYIADSNHNRVVVTKLDGTLVEIIGGGARGALDGGYEQATFHRPQGLALDGQTLYVADTENHLIRRVDLQARAVSTVAGTGEQRRTYEMHPGPARYAALNSPWDLQLVGRTLYIAMAGPHQIWKLDLDRGEIAVFAGTGQEARLDGARNAAAFAQPSGLATDGRNTLYVADAESNVVRAVELDRLTSADKLGLHDTASSESPATGTTTTTTGQVRTLAGGDLFEFGDVDGSGDGARLQHPLGVLYQAGALFIADTYNHKIKRLDLATGAVKTFAGTGKPGQADGNAPSFYEPGGLGYADGKLYIADTNNHAVRVLDARTGITTTLPLRGLQPPNEGAVKSDAANATALGNAPNANEIKLQPQRLHRTVKGDGALAIEVTLPQGYHLNPSAPQSLRVSIERGADRVALADPAPGKEANAFTRTGKEVRLPLRLALNAPASGAAELRAQTTLYYCREDNTGTCRIKTLVWRVPVEVTDAADAPREINLRGVIMN